MREMILHPIFVKQSSFSIMRNSIISLLFLLVLGAFVENACWGQVGRQVYLVELEHNTDFSDVSVNR